ncbi:putative Calcium-binding EF-hand family protein [Hibiscus syriacus]|uniref:Calcium-binding EF-hand family protein n=1 Tax=Hibiscus syriacus TaxID=106335 RepID=A0A6A3BI25_HIBSY|nr:putative Calcium-binding EF-hand family protein [Hibiscus syriacus]
MGYKHIVPKGPRTAAGKQELRKVFMDCDIDDNRILTKEEIKKAFDRFGSFFPGFRAWRALQHVDKNKDGCVSVEELDDLIEYAYKRGYINVS